jgi:hypothetical protein
LIVSVEIELETHVQEVQQLDLSRTKGLLLGTIGGLKDFALNRFAQQVQGFHHHVEHLVKDALLNLHWLNNDIIIVLLFAVLLNE